MRRACVLLLLVSLVAAALPAAADAPFVVVIDAGHGGRDPGALSADGAPEKTVTLAVARRVARLLSVEPGVLPVLTRTDDRYISLADRLAIVASTEADLFLSLHADSLPSRPDVRGASVYTLAASASTPEAARKAQRENAEDLRVEPITVIADPVLQAMVTGLVRTFVAERSARFAALVVDELDGVTELLPRPHLAADFVVLRSLQTPSVLVEVGYLSNAAEARGLADPAHLDGVAAGLVRAVLRQRQLEPTPERTAPLAAATAARID